MGEKLKTIFMPFSLVRKNLMSLIGFELICRLLSVFVFFPILTWMQRLFLLFNGTTAIAAYNYKRFLLNPLTWVVLIAQALLITVFAMFERFALVDTLHASKCRKKLGISRIFHNAFDLTIDRFKPRNWGLIPYAIFVLHFGMFTDVSSVTSFIRIPGFILEDFRKRPYEQVLYYIGIVALFYLFLRWAFTIPIMMEYDDKSFRSARKKSWEMTRGMYFLYVFVVSVFWIGLTILMLSALSAAAVLIWYLLYLWLLPGTAEGIVPFFKSRISGTYLILYIGFSWVSGPLILSSFQAIYYRRKEKLKEHVRPYTEERDYLRTFRPVRICAVAGILLCVFFSGPKVFAKARWILNTRYGLPLIMAHRGYSDAAPENTIPAFEKAIDEGFTAAELDVQMTKDGQIVVFHDNNLKRITGVDRNIWDVTYDEIKNLDAGSHFGKEYEGVTIPTLAEVLSLCNDKLFLNIEIKRNGHDEGIVEKTISDVMTYGKIDNCDITSQDYRTIEEIRSINPSILTAYTSVIGIGDLQKFEAADILSIQETFATYTNIENLHNAGKRVFVWTVNEEDTMEQLVALNVDAILTNNPGLCKEVVERYESDAMNFVRRLQNILVFM